MSSYSILSRPEYFSELDRRINAAKTGDRVALASMSLEHSEPGVNKILNSLNNAALRGVKTNLIIDAYSFMAGGNMLMPGPLFWHTQLPKHLGKNHSLKLKALENLKQSGGNYTITNRPTHRFTPPFKGRSHIKFATINDYLFIGNCNLDKEDQIDLMIGWQNTIAADWLYDFSQKIIDAGTVTESLGSKKDQELKLSADSWLLLDAGLPNQSIIFKESLKLIDSAQESIVFTCQYFPDKAILDHLVSAHNRGVDVKLIYNHPLNRSPGLAVAHYLNKAKSRLSRPGFLFEHQLPRHSTYLHAKLLVTEKAVMIGSHNFVEAGVKFGTAEIALLSNDPLFSKRAIQAIEKQIS